LLAEALNKYEGSYILVSHDRYFISKTANKIWEIDNGKIKEFKGPYEEWVEWNKRMNAQMKPTAGKQKNEKPEAETAKPQMVQHPINKDVKKLLQKQQRIVDQLDEKIRLLKEECSKLELRLTEPEVYADKKKFVEAEIAFKKSDLALSEARISYDTALEKLIALEETQS
jgi:ATP-binding cassette subfamily F protein 3